MASELKPCPFCNSDRITVHNIRDGQQAVCKDCGSHGKPVFHGPKGPGATWGEAVAAWNTRPAPVAPVSPDATGKCGELVRYNHDNETLSGLSQHKEGTWCLHSQAEELLAAKDARIKELEKLCNDTEAEALDYASDKAELEVKLDTANALVTCCCGDPVDAHNMGSGHSPVDQYHYAMMQLEAKLAAAEKALETKSAANEALSKAVVESIDTEKRLREALELIADIDTRPYRCAAIARAVLGGKP